MRIAKVVAVLAVLLVPARARAEEPLPAAAAAAAPAPPSPFVPAPDVPTLGPGVAVGYDNGLWATSFAQALRVRIPFGAQWGLMVKGVLTHPSDHAHNAMPHYGGGRLEVFGSTLPIGGFARVYGGGGVVVTTKVLGTGGNKDVNVGLGGAFGLEVFMSRRVSFVFEVGGSSNPDGTAAGALVTAGIQWYLGR